MAWLRHATRMTLGQAGDPGSPSLAGSAPLRLPGALLRQGYAGFPRQRIEGWGIDPEPMFLAQRAGLRVEEVAVVWSRAEGAKVYMLRDSVRMLVDVMAIRVAAARGLYREAPELAAAA